MTCFNPSHQLDQYILLLLSQLHGPRKFLSDRSALFRILFHAEHGEILRQFSFIDQMIMFLGIFFMCIGIVLFLLFVPAFVFFVLYGIFFPILHLISSFIQAREIPLLPYVLTIVYVLFLLVLFAMAPLIYKFHAVRYVSLGC